MMGPKPGLTKRNPERNDDFFIREIERTQAEYSFAWEGLSERVVDLGEALIRADSPTSGLVMRLALRPEAIEERLPVLIARVAQEIPSSLWVVTPSTSPVDLGPRLARRGFTPAIVWEGLVWEDLSRQFPPDTPADTSIQVEALSWDNLEAFAVEASGSQNPQQHEVRRGAARRYLEAPPSEVHICLARIQGVVAGYAKQWVMAKGLTNLREAFTLPAFRRQGVYTALVAHRLEVARSLGCQAALLRAQAATSAPILKKRGFRAVCHLTGWQAPKP